METAAPALFSPKDIPDWLPNEPRRPPLSGVPMGVALVKRSLLLTLLLPVTMVLYPLYWLSTLVYGFPPNVPRMAQVRRYVRLIWTVNPPAPGLQPGIRMWMMLEVVRKLLVTPIWGLAWQLDEVLYGSKLRKTEVKAPLIEISAARSGSTQLARYLEEDPHLVAPSLLESVFPYLWLWKLVPVTLGRFVTKEQIHARMEATMPPEFIQRHEGDPFRTDTFDIVLYAPHMNTLCPFLGPQIMIEDFGFASMVPHNRNLWEVDFVNLLDGIARKTLLHKGRTADGQTRRFFVKGHFLAAADALEKKYPDATFLTMIREPVPRMQSAVNFMRANPVAVEMGAIPWPWLGETLSETEVVYSELEQEWFLKQGPARRCVVRFNEYVKDLEGTMQRVYHECMGLETLPPHVPRVHPPRERTNYILNRSLAQVGVSEAAVNARLARYIAWCRGSGGSGT